jgi:hypothetical protein
MYCVKANVLLTQTHYIIIEIIDQLPPLLTSIATGEREFVPSPSDTKEVCRRMYR